MKINISTVDVDDIIAALEFAAKNFVSGRKEAERYNAKLVRTKAYRYAGDLKRLNWKRLEEGE